MAESTLARFPALAREVGPVAASSGRLASRYSNAIRGGHPAKQWRDLGLAHMVWIQVPAENLSSTVLRLLEEVPDWRGKTVVLLDPMLDCTALAPLAAQGASVASMTHAPLVDSEIAVVEGDAAAIRKLRPVLRRARLRIVVLAAGAKMHYTAGLMVAAALAGPLADAAWRCLQAAGLDQASTKKIAGKVIERAIRDFQAHGRKAWISPAAGSRREATYRQVESLRAINPGMAGFVEDSLQAVFRWFGEPAEWLKPLRRGASHRG